MNIRFARWERLVLIAVLAHAAAAGAAEKKAEILPTIPVPYPKDPVPAASSIDITFGGRIKLDAMYTRTSDGDIPTPSFPRDQYQPAGIPVAGSSGAEDPHSFFDYTAKGTILWFKASAHVGEHALGSHVEMDFRINPGAGNEIVTNGWTPGLRHAYLTYDDWLFGQTFTLFRNINAAPDTMESAGGAIESLVIVRQPQVRYTLGGFAVSLENSETVLTANGGASTRNVTGDSQLPDVVVRYDLKTGFGEYAAAGLVRELRADNVTMTPVAADGSTTAYGLMLSGKLPAFGEDDVRFNVTFGNGISRYATAATVDDAVVKADGSLETIDTLAGYAVYRHVWTPRWRSNLLLSAMMADNDTPSTGLAVTQSVTSAHLNTLYSPVEKLTFGAQLIHAIREIEQPRAGGDSGEYGTLTRFQLTGMWSF
jgi:hypothetical protein